MKDHLLGPDGADEGTVATRADDCRDDRVGIGVPVEAGADDGATAGEHAERGDECAEVHAECSDERPECADERSDAEPTTVMSSPGSAGEIREEPPSPAVLRLLAALEEVAGEPLDSVGAEPLGADLIALRSGIDRLEAVFTHRLRRFRHLQGHALWGAPRIAAWLRHACRMRIGRAQQTVEMARHLEELPDIDRAFSRGELGLDHVTAVVRVAGQVGDEVVASVTPALLESAQILGVDSFRLATRHLRHLADADGAQEEANRLRAREWFQLSQTLDDLWILDGRLAPENGLVLQTALHALMGKPSRDDRRDPSQRRAAALGELARRSLDSGSLPRVGGQKPHLLLVAGLDSLRGLPNALPPELAGIGPVPLATALRLTCDPVVEAIIDAGGSAISAATSLSPPGARAGMAAGAGPGADPPTAPPRPDPTTALLASVGGRAGPATAPSSAGVPDPGHRGDPGARGPGRPDASATAASSETEVAAPTLDDPPPLAYGGTAERLSRLFRDLTTQRILPIASGSAVRLVPPALRRAVTARDRACRGCEREARWCDCHHIVHWVNDGPTVLWNLLLLCGHCHSLVHDHGYTVRLLPDAQVRFSDPSGRVLRGPPAAA